MCQAAHHIRCATIPKTFVVPAAAHWFDGALGCARGSSRFCEGPPEAYARVEHHLLRRAGWMTRSVLEPSPLPCPYQYGLRRRKKFMICAADMSQQGWPPRSQLVRLGAQDQLRCRIEHRPIRNAAPRHSTQPSCASKSHEPNTETHITLKLPSRT